MYNGPTLFGDEKVSETDDLPFYCLGFGRPSPESTLRTRFRSSLRAQTFCRTISGMMSHRRTIDPFYPVANPGVVRTFGDNADKLEPELGSMTWRKVCVHRFHAAVLKVQQGARECRIPTLSISRAPGRVSRGGTSQGYLPFFSAFTDGHSEFNTQAGER